MLVLFILIYVCIFMYSGHIYTLKLHDVRKFKTLLRIDYLEESELEELHSKIGILEKKIKINIRISYYVIAGVFALNLLFLLTSKKTHGIDYVYAVILLASVLLFMLILYWLKGHAAIDSARRFNRDFF